MFKAGEMAEAVGGRLLAGASDKAFTNFSKDTRTIGDGDFYIPLIGERFDGHDYIQDALKKGASGFFIAQGYAKKDEVLQVVMALGRGAGGNGAAGRDLAVIEVADTLLALQTLASYNRSRKSRVKLVAVTGSVGKTSTKEMINSVLEQGFTVLKTEGNLNNEIGLPLTLLRLEEEEVCVVEMGMSSLGEISLLSKLARPDIAAITNIGVAHIGILGSQENIFKAKMEILDGLKEGGLLVVNGDDPLLKTIGPDGHFRLMKYGIENSDADLRASGVSGAEGITGAGSASEQFTVDGRSYSLNTIGKHNVYNALCGLVIGRELGLSEDQIQKGYTSYKNAGMRMQQIRLQQGILIINDAYNANYDSMKAGIEAVQSMNAGRKIVVLGDMYELGDFSLELHRRIGGLIDPEKVEFVITCGVDAAEISKAAASRSGTSAGFGDRAVHFAEKKDAASKLQELVREGDLVYFKASRGMKLEELVNGLVEQFGLEREDKA